MTAQKPAIGHVLDGKYRIERVLGEGGMGIVYEAVHTKLEQRVAIKLMLPEMQDRPNLLARFEREARAAAKLKSKHVPRVYDVDVTSDGLPFIVMELLTGRDLATLLEQRQLLPAGEAVHYIMQAASALREAHVRGIVHRDLKPANVFLAEEDDGVVVKVLDFGISKELLSGKVGLTSEHAIVGTVFYMSPEQVRAGTIDHRSDIWSLGALLFELLSGRPPFLGSLTRVSADIVSVDPPELRSLRPEVPAGLAAAVHRALQRNPNARFPDMLTLMQALEPFSPSRSLTSYEDRASQRRVSSPSFRGSPKHEEVDPSAATLDHSDNVRSPTFAHPKTADGLATEASRQASPRTRRTATLVAVATATFLLGGGVLLSLRSLLGTPPAISPATSHPSIIAPEAGDMPNAVDAALPPPARSAPVAAPSTPSAPSTTPSTPPTMAPVRRKGDRSRTGP